MLVEIREARDGADDVGGFVHHDHARRAEPGLQRLQAVEVHRQVLAFARRDAGHRRAAGNDGKQIVPAAAHAACVMLDQLAERHAHLLFHVAGLVHVAGDAEDLGAGVVGPAERGEPGGAAPEDVGHDRDGLDIVDGGRRAVEPDIGREWRLQPRHALLAFEAFEQRGLLAADIGAGAVMQIKIEVPAVDVAGADQLCVVGFVDRRLQPLALADELPAYVDVGGVRAHGEGGEQRALDQELRVVAHDVPVLAGAGLGLVRIDHEIVRAAVRLLRHERPFEPGGEARAAAAAQARRLYLLDDRLVPARDHRRGAVPGAARARGLKPPAMVAVEILEDAVLVLQHHSRLGLRPLLRGGFGSCAARGYWRPCPGAWRHDR